MDYILSIILLLPLLVAVVMGIMRASLERLKIASLSVSLMVLLFVLFLAVHFDSSQGMQFIYIAPWITNYGITYFVGIDAISLLLLLLISFLMPLVFLSIWDEEKKGYFYNLLLLQTGVTGVVISLDLILFYLFWESMLLPIFIMIGSYGYGMRHANGMKIILMTVLGSMSMLFSMLYLGYMHFKNFGYWSFAVTDLTKLSFDPQTSIVLAGGFLLAFAIKIPLFGFHTWMAPAYNSSPTPALVILSAIMAKLGVYGLFRFSYTLFEEPLVEYTPYMITLALIGVIFYSIHAVMERNLKRVFAFSSGSHLSLIALGLFLTNIYAWSGGVYLIGTHAIATAGIFLMIGMLGNRTDDIRMANLGGIASVAPRFAFFFVFFALSIAGIPGTGGFVAELLIIIGAFKYNFWVGVLSATTMLGAILFVFWTLQRTIYGKTQEATHQFKDLDALEIGILIPLALILVLTGIFPSFFLEFFQSSLESSLNALGVTQ